MVLTFKHDGTGFVPSIAEVAVTITASAHTYAGERQAGRNWLTWDPNQDECWHSDTLAEAVWLAGEMAADLMGGCVLAEVAGVAVPDGWDAVALIAESWQSDPPFSDWPEVIDRPDLADLAGASA